MEWVWRALEVVWRGSRGFQGGSIGGGGCVVTFAKVEPLFTPNPPHEPTFGHAYHSHTHLSWTGLQGSWRGSRGVWRGSTRWGWV